MPSRRDVKRYLLDQSPFYRLSSKRRLARVLHLTLPQLRRLTASSDTHYREWDEVNDNGKRRHIENPGYQLKQVQRRIAKLLSRIVPPTFLYCPVKGRSYVDNARAHSGNHVVRTLDIHAYFPSTPSRRVYWFFHK